MIEILCKSPRDCSAADLASFCNLVRLGGQVNNAVLEAGVKRARSLAFALAAGRVGHPYPSGEHADEELALFVRDGAVK